MNTFSKHLIVVGGGAAGIFCAVNAAAAGAADEGRGGLKVTVLEKTGKLLSKVRISGGGRCNVTHACYDIAEMSKRYPRGGQFVRKAFYRWAVKDTIEWFAQRGVQLKTEPDGRMFPVSNSSQTIIDCLLNEISRYNVDVHMHAEVKDVLVADTTDAGGPRFQVKLSDGRVLTADYVCIAAGGYPKSTMFDWIRRLGHSVEEPVPSLFTFNMPGNPITKLMGVSVSDVQIKIAGFQLMERGPILITHWGLSGPAVLRISAWGARELKGGGYRFTGRVNWLPEFSEQRVRERLQEIRFEWAARAVGSGNPFGLPQRLWEYWLNAVDMAPGVRWADLPAKYLNKLVTLLCAGEFDVDGKTTFKEEFVTAGGVRLSEVDPSTCQSRRVDGLYFAGEILDVDGITGGFNFQHAWTSGWIVADSVVSRGFAKGGELSE